MFEWFKKFFRRSETTAPVEVAREFDSAQVIQEIQQSLTSGRAKLEDVGVQRFEWLIVMSNGPMGVHRTEPMTESEAIDFAHSLGEIIIVMIDRDRKIILYKPAPK